jgi:ParB family chromosome partitioning protein
MQTKYSGLGKGLSALLREEVLPINNDEEVYTVNIEKIEAGKLQPRKNFEYDKIRELANSIASSGLLQPIIVTTSGDGNYKIVAGERRWRACKMVGLTDIPVIIKNLTDKETLEIALIENIQREELSVIEESEGFERLMNEFGYTQEKLAEILGKSRSHIANLLRLNNLPQSVKDKVHQKLISMGHARCLIGHEHAESIAGYIIENDLSVRQTENLVKNWSKKEYVNAPRSNRLSNKISQEGNDSDLHLLAKALSEKFGLKVSIENYPVGGKLIFHYNDLEQLDTILSRL